MESQKPTSRNIIERYTRGYLIALGMVALLTVAGLTVLQQLVSNEQDESSLINKTGKQRFYSQQITKAILVLADSVSENRKLELATAYSAWVLSQQELQLLSANPKFGHLLRSQEVAELVAAQKDDYLVIGQAAKSMIDHKGDNASLRKLASAAGRKVLSVEGAYWVNIDKTVTQLNLESNARIQLLGWLQIGLAAIIVLLLGIETLFIFRPLSGVIHKFLANEVSARHQLTRQTAVLRQIQLDNETYIKTLAESQKQLEASLDEALMLKSQVEWREFRLIEAQAIGKMASFETDGLGQLTRWTSHFPKLHGIPADSAPNRYPLTKHIHLHDQAAFKVQWLDNLKRGIPFNLEYRIIREGTTAWIHCHAKPVLNAETQQYYYVGTIQDVTDEKEAFEQITIARDLAQQATIAKTMFLSTMSHEIRTPLNAVIGFTELLMLEDPKPSQVESLEILKYSANHLLSLINDILDFNKIDSGKIEFEQVEFDLSQVLQSVGKLFSLKVEEKKLGFTIIEPAKFGNYLVSDVTRFNQILHNLVSNALKFTEQGQIEIGYSIERETDTEVNLTFYVSDTGIGISEEGKAKLFQAFTQAHSSTTRLFGGTGLGLSISKRLVELQGGRIWVESEKDKGTKFYFNLSFGKGGLIKQNAMLPYSHDHEERRNLEQAEILVVDDNAINVMIAQKFIERWHGRVTTCSDGQQAIDLIAQTQFDVILMDLQMPVMDGFAATSWIRAQAEPNILHLPVVALTASVALSLQEEVMSKGFDAYVSKPFNPAELYRVIRNHIKKPTKNGVYSSAGVSTT